MLAYVFLVCLLGSVLSADILAVFPHTGKSHYDVFEPLVLALAARGHRVTVVSFFPQNTAVANYTDISLVGNIPVLVDALNFELVEGSMDPITNFVWVSDMALSTCQAVLTSPQVKDLLKPCRNFDLMIVELFNAECFLGFAHFFRIPYIGVSSSLALPHVNSRIGNPDSLSYSSNIFFPFSRHMGFLQRMINTFCTLGMRFVRSLYYLPLEQKTASRVFGEEADLLRLAHNASLVLVNTHHSLQGARPLVPGYVEIGGLHIQPEKSLSKELERYLNDSTEGALLFSMGSVLQSSSFPADKRQAVMDAFAELPVRVIMKWENESLPGKPDNVRLSKWLPQRDIMAHPKIVAFMGHGGLLSTSEAVYCGVPMVLIPMFGDQPNNVAHLEATGAAVKLSYDSISKETVLQALRAILYDPKYRERAKTLSAEFRDRPMSPLDTAIYWTEYVIRHKGAPHLRSAAVDMPWYQLWLLDVILALLVALFVLLLVVFWLAKRITILISQHLYLGKRKNKAD